MGKLILLLQLLVVFLIGWFSHELFSEKLTSNTFVYNQIRSDLSALEEKKELPPEFQSIAYFDFNFTPDSATKALGNKTDIYPTNPNGKYFIGTEVFIKAEEPNILIFQFSIHEKKSRNKVSELAREYKIKP